MTVSINASAVHGLVSSPNTPTPEVPAPTLRRFYFIIGDQAEEYEFAP